MTLFRDHGLTLHRHRRNFYRIQRDDHVVGFVRRFSSDDHWYASTAFDGVAANAVGDTIPEVLHMLALHIRVNSKVPATEGVWHRRRETLQSILDTAMERTLA